MRQSKFSVGEDVYMKEFDTIGHIRAKMEESNRWIYLVYYNNGTEHVICSESRLAHE